MILAKLTAGQVHFSRLRASLVVTNTSNGLFDQQMLSQAPLLDICNVCLFVWQFVMFAINCRGECHYCTTVKGFVRQSKDFCVCMFTYRN